MGSDDAKKGEAFPKEKLLQILKKVEGTDNVEIVSSDVGAGSEKGENFAGTLLRADLKIKVNGEEEKEHHWMIKTSSEVHGLGKELHSEEKEVIYYRDKLPKWNATAREKGIKEINGCPTPYLEISEDGACILVMKNLIKEGYGDPPKKKKGLGLAHTQMVMEEIARFHALGYHYLKSYPGGTDEGRKKNEVFVTDFVYANPGPTLAAVMKGTNPANTMPLMASYIQEPGQDLAGYITRFNIEKDLLERMGELMRPNRDGFNVLNHGDLHFNNMLFTHKEDGETPEKVCFLDASIQRWASPATDLAYFLFSSVTPMLRETHLEEILGCYHDEFSRCLAKLGEDPAVYPFRQLLKDFDRFCFVGFYVSFTALPWVLAPKEEAIGQDIFTGDVDAKVKAATLKMKRAVEKEPQIKIMLGGNLLYLIKKGIMK